MSDSEDFTAKPLRKALKEVLDTLNDAIGSAKTIYRVAKAAKEPSDLYTHRWKLTREARKLVKLRYASIEEILDLWIPAWKAEGRLSETLRVPAAEAELLGLAPESEVDVYALSNRIPRLFKK